MASRTPVKRASSGEALGLKLLQSVREMQSCAESSRQQELTAHRVNSKVKFDQILISDW